jgi:Homeodomain
MWVEWEEENRFRSQLINSRLICSDIDRPQQRLHRRRHQRLQQEEEEEAASQVISAFDFTN